MTITVCWMQIDQAREDETFQTFSQLTEKFREFRSLDKPIRHIDLHSDFKCSMSLVFVLIDNVLIVTGDL